MSSEDPRNHPGAARRQGTVLESVEEIRAQLRGSATMKEAALRPPAPSPGADLSEETLPFRPTRRPSMALLCVLDDGDDDGELIRLRATSFVIGRVEGNLVIPHDNGISGRHAEVSRRVENGEFTWHLKDLQSTNGTFVRASNVVLYHEQELLIGGRRFLFESPSSAAVPASVPGPQANATRKWEALPSAVAAGPASRPTLVEITPGSDPKRHPLNGPEVWLGRDPRQCSIVVEDPMVDRRHARISCDEKRRWIITNANSRNGLWARIQEVGLGRGGYFQCGEQRFLIKIL